MSDPAPAESQPVRRPFWSSRVLLLDLGTSYVASIARVAAMASAMAFLFRTVPAGYVAVFVATRSAVSIFSAMFAGVAPTRLQALAALDANVRHPVANPFPDAAPSRSLDYESAPTAMAYEAPPEARLTHTNAAIALLTCIALVLAAVVAALLPAGDDATRRHLVVTEFIFVFMLGAIARLSSDGAGATLQYRGRIWLDNGLTIVGEVAFVAAVLTKAPVDHDEALRRVAATYLWSGVLIALLRHLALWLPAPATGPRAPHAFSKVNARSFGYAIGGLLLLSAAQLGDLLYGPANVLLIGYTLGASDLAAYGPLLQIDGALLLLVGAMAAITLPRVAQAKAQGNIARVRRIYCMAALASLGILATAAAILSLARASLISLWLGQPPPETLALLPLVLIHTVIGGTAGVGRAVLLGMGRFRAYTISALLGGIMNVTLALTFVLGFGWGLRGIVFATILAVTIRCVIWMPWYILRSLRSPAPAPAAA